MMGVSQNKMTDFWMWIQVIFCHFFGRRRLCDCGHYARQKTIIKIDGRRLGVYSLYRDDYCPQCWAKAAIRCPKCGEVILPGDRVTLYTLDEFNPFTSDPLAPSVIFHGGRLVACCSMECILTGKMPDGTWVMPGKVQMSPLEEIVLAATED